jgi:hypothetical protein
MQVLSPKDVEVERNGITIDGTKWYPRAEPLKMLRIFRTRFSGLGEAQAEVKRVKIIEDYLGPDNFARSEEFLVDYSRNGKHELILCGLQEYVKGVVLNPWRSVDQNQLRSLSRQLGFEEIGGSGTTIEQWVYQVRKQLEDFIGKVKRMIVEARHVPDLAGVGNLLITPSGIIKLVDINNISQVLRDGAIHLDEKGYPVCDKSIEALAVLEGGVLARNTLREDPAFRTFFDPGRMKEVRAIVREFFLSVDSTNGYLESSPT